MASNIHFNGTKYPDTSNIGSYFRNVQPPTFVAGATYFKLGVLDQAWGSRLAEMSGRIRGLSGIGTFYRANGTLSINLLAGWFNYTPIVNIQLLTKIPPIYLNPNDQVNYTGDAQLLKTEKEYFIIPIHLEGPARPALQVRSITNSSFLIIYNRNIYGSDIGGYYPHAYLADPFIIHWHAFGL